jgi:hypothetical protein
VARLEEKSHADLESFMSAGGRMKGALALPHEDLHPLFNVEDGQHPLVKFKSPGLQSI